MEFAWAKALYEAFGVPYPMLSQIGVVVLGALLLGVPWFVLGLQHQKEQLSAASEAIAVPIQSTQNVTNSPNSPSIQVAGNKNNVVINPERVEGEQSAPRSVGIKADGVVGLHMEGNLFEGIDDAMDIKNSAEVTAKNNKIIGKNDQPKQFPPPTGEFRNLSNSDLREHVKNIADAMRSAESKADEKTKALLMQQQVAQSPQESKKNWDVMNAKLEKIRDKQNVEFQRSFRPQATALASEMLVRLRSIVAPPDFDHLSIRSGGEVLIHGMLVGAHPMSAAADFLEFMANKLTQ